MVMILGCLYLQLLIWRMSSTALSPFCFPHLAFWCDRGLAKCPVIVVISASIRATSSSPIHHTCGRLVLQPRVSCSLGIWAWCQPAWGVGDFWFHSDTIPGWAGGCSQSHLVRFPLFMLKYRKYLTVNPSFLSCDYYQNTLWVTMHV